MRREEPQSWRDEALARLRRGGERDWLKAVRLLMRVCDGNWHARHAQIELVAGTELGRALTLLAPGGRAGLRGAALQRAAALWRPLTAAVRVVLRWTVDDCDVELSVRERRSGAWARGLRSALPSGGMLSRNFGGLGPQEFLAKRMHAGGYDFFVRVHQRTAKSNAEFVSVQLHVFTNYGEPLREDERIVSVRLACEPERDRAKAVFVCSVE